MDGVQKGLVSSLVLLRAHSYSGGVTYHPLSKLYSSLHTYHLGYLKNLNICIHTCHLGYLKNLKKNRYILTLTYIHLATPETKTALQINSMSIKILKVWPKIFKVMCVNLKPLIAQLICVVSATMQEEGKGKQLFIMPILTAEHKI